jgi:hypothetical protein
VITLKAELVSVTFREASRPVIATRQNCNASCFTRSYSSAAVVEAGTMENCSAKIRSTEGNCALRQDKENLVRPSLIPDEVIFLYLPNPFGRTRPCGLLSLLQK